MKIFRNVFGKTEKEIIDAAFARCAKLDADCAEQATLIELYGALVGTIDHTTDWWSYAHAKEALHNAGVEYNAIREKADAARAQANGLLGITEEAPF